MPTKQQYVKEDRFGKHLVTAYQEYKSGPWYITHKDGNETVLSDAKFQKRYVKYDEKATAQK